MIKVTKVGESPKEKVFKAKCHKCGGEFTYQWEDVHSDQREGDYVECPTVGCGQFINHTKITAYDYYNK